MLDPDFRELLSAFNGQGVRYLIVGGYAVSFHAQPRATKDLDIFVATDEQNCQRIFKALAEFGAPLSGFTPEDLTAPGSFFRMGSPPVMVEIFPEITGVSFDAAWERREEVIVDPETKLTAFVISRQDLVTAKLATARPQDLADVDAIRHAERSKSRLPE